MRTIPLLAELETALASGSNARRIRILTRITDLLVANAARYSADQIGVFDQVMTPLVHAVDAKARATLAQRLAPIANAPATVLHMLALDDDIAVAGPVLAGSERLGERALLAAADKSPLHLAAVARRRLLREAATEVLVARGDRDVVKALVRNPDARFSDAGFRMLVERAVGDDALATEIGRRHDMPRAHFLMLMVQASRAARAALAGEASGEHPGAGRAVADGLAGQPHEAGQVRHGTPDFAAALADVERIRPIGEAEIYQFARAGKLAHTAVALSILCELPVDVVARALLDPGTIVPILARVAGLSLNTTKTVLLLRKGAENDLHRALAEFERLQPQAARRVLGFLRTRIKKPGAKDSSAAAVDAPHASPEGTPRTRLSGAGQASLR